MAWWRRFLAGGAAGYIALAILAQPFLVQPVRAEPDKLGLTTHRLPWNENDRNDTTVGAFEWMGSIVATADRKRFGGWSGLAVSADGSSLLAVSDEGKWFSAKILYDEKERIAGIGDGRIGTLKGQDGRPLSRALGYASGIAADSINLQSGFAYVSFERAHRIWRYQLTANGIEGKPQVIINEDRLGKLAAGGGIEGVTLMNSSDPRSQNKQLLAVTENTRDARGNVRAFIIDGKKRKRLSIRLHDPFHPVDIVKLPDGDYLLLERHFSLLTGAASIQLRRIAREDVKPGKPIEGQVVLDVKDKRKVDNMEGMALRQDRSGDVWIYLISDNNFNQLQRTQLTMFRMKKLPPAAATAPTPTQ